MRRIPRHSSTVHVSPKLYCAQGQIGGGGKGSELWQAIWGGTGNSSNSMSCIGEHAAGDEYQLHLLRAMRFER